MAYHTGEVSDKSIECLCSYCTLLDITSSQVCLVTETAVTRQ